MIDGWHAALEADLAARAAAQARMADALVELDRHPGLVLLSGGPLTGTTAHRWSAAREVLAGLWTDFATHRSVLAEAEAARHRGDAARVSHLLRSRSVEDSRTAVPLRERGLTGASERVAHIDLATLTARMETAFTQLSELVEDVWTAQDAAVAQVVGLAEQVAEARRLAGELSAEQAAVADLARRLGELERAATTDPLGPAGDPAPLLADAAAVTGRLRHLAAVRDDWPGRAARLDHDLDALDDLRRLLLDDRDRTVALVVTALPPPPPDRRTELRARRAAVASMTDWRPRASAAAALDDALDAESAALRAAHALVTGLLERRDELRGRHRAFRAKAQRLGRAEHAEVLRLEDELRATLWARPSDLAAATRALAAYQRELGAPGTVDTADPERQAPR